LKKNSFVNAVKKYVSEDEAEKLTKTPDSVVKKEVLGSKVTGQVERSSRMPHASSTMRRLLRGLKQ